MTEKKTLLGTLILMLSLVFSAVPAAAQEEQGAQEEHAVHAEQQSWTFAGVFGTYDQNQLRRGFQIFSQSCASCHSLEYIAFRNLAESGGPEYSEEQVRALAEQFTIADPDVEGGEREGIPADRWPDPFPSDQIARDANGGALPPDLSLIAKARSIHLEFPWWIFSYFTAYQEGGADYIYNLLTNYEEAPEGVEMQPGQYYNAFFDGHAIAMPPPLADGMIDYEGEGTPETVEQYSRDIAAFLQWAADPHMVHRKELGFRVIIFLIGFAVLMYLVKRRIWRDAH